MLNTIIEFHKSVFRMPLPWAIWLMVLMAVNMIGPLFFLNQLEGQVVLVVFLVSAGLMMLLFAAKGFTRILGAGHILWLGLVPWLWARLELAPSEGLLSTWILIVIVLNGLSLIIDIVDVIRYARGDRQPTVSTA